MLSFDPTLRSNETIKVGDYLDPYLLNAEKVMRYLDPRYPKYMVSDRLCDHIFRLRKMVSQLPLSVKDIRTIDRIVLVHDLPETILGDITAVLKREKGLDTKNETKVAKEILSSEDFALYTQFNNAESFLFGVNSYTSNKNAIVAKVLDSIEGCLYFHNAVVKWVLKGKKTLPPEISLVYFFDVVLKYKDNIHDKKLNMLVNSLLSQALHYIELLWIQNERKTPTVIKQNIIRQRSFYL